MARETTRKAAQTGSSEPQIERDIDPNVLQRRASTPESSIWVGASAGSGKTKVLTDRVLRLLLPRPDGMPGTPPHKILCLTFTKAGAGEMTLRLAKTLSNWAVMPGERLETELRALLGRAAISEELKAARRLFAEVVDAPGGLRIMTIHSFCQSVLSRFPLEAGLPPQFMALDERQAGALLQEAQDSVLREAESEKAGPLAAALYEVGGAVNDARFFGLLRNIAAERRQLRRLLEQNFGVEGLYARLCETLKIPPGARAEDLCREACEERVFDAASLRAAALDLCEAKNVTDQKFGRGLADWLAAPVPERMAGFENYAALFLTQEGEIRKNLGTKTFLGAFPQHGEILAAEARRILKLADLLAAARAAALSRDLLILGAAMLQRYATIKEQRGALDFDDLIVFTLDLLRKENMTGWVLYKLDQGIDHILIDEAQDTNPEQWEIIEALSSEFASGMGARDASRTVFTVGDEKQSIYSFQRASPEEFRRMRGAMERKIRDAGQPWDQIPLNISFRSTRSVLRAVDAVFKEPALRKGLASAEIRHELWRRGQAGLVEFWPLRENEEGENPGPWEPPIRIIEQKTGAAKLAQDIARKIRGWLDNGEMLQSRNRAIRPEDILILVRTRNAFFRQLARALKAENIPVSGVDRMVLNEQLAAQDLLALAEFALLPSDDLTLATILKGPLIGWNEERLYEAAQGRSHTLWEAIQNHEKETAYLSGFIRMAQSAHPYEFFSAALQSPCPADEISGWRAFRKRLGTDALDPLDELLRATLGFEKDNIASLQGFLRWQNNDDSEIKREMEEARGEVRIMTVHGAKGLQAPIVILPDTVKTTSGGAPSAADGKILWPDNNSGLPAPFWAPRADMECAAFLTAKARLRERQEEEARRLLYVAMTRAEDRLYVAGHQGKRAGMPNSWYFAMKAGLERLEEHEVLEDGTIRVENPQTKEPDRTETVGAVTSTSDELPAWLFQPAPLEPTPPRPLIPSRPSEEDAPPLSPLANENAQRFRRGLLTHKLLQFLPDLPPQNRERAAREFVSHYGEDLPSEIRESVAAETLKALNHSEFAPIFGPGSQAEVPLAGLINETRVISGQIDRLLVTESGIWIIDYKTNRPPPTDPADVPAVYISQMNAYAAALKVIYPGRPVHCALLWTDGPFLMPLPSLA